MRSRFWMLLACNSRDLELSLADASAIVRPEWSAYDSLLRVGSSKSLPLTATSGDGRLYAGLAT